MFYCSVDDDLRRCIIDIVNFLCFFTFNKRQSQRQNISTFYPF